MAKSKKIVDKSKAMDFLVMVGAVLVGVVGAGLSMFYGASRVEFLKNARKGYDA